MKILGLNFAGSATGSRPQMVAFIRGTLGLEPVDVGGAEATMFSLPDGSIFAVSDAGGMGDTGRSIGFEVDDVNSARAELLAAGVEVDEIAVNDWCHYCHFVAPDGQLYELTQRSG